MDSILVFSGLDPCAGAGAVADIETIHQFGLTPFTIITNLSVQNTCSVQRLHEVDSDLISEQYQHLQDDSTFEVVKIGLLSSVQQIQTIAALIQNKTVVLDPVVRASTGKVFLDVNLVAALKQYLLPLATITTPNQAELYALSGETNEQKAINKLDCEWVLLTTTDNSDADIEHRLYQRQTLVQRFHYQKLPGQYHGSGCTLTSAIAALIATGTAIDVACGRALDYTYQSLLNAKQLGKMQYHLNRHKP